jgi:hypothetical protein
MSSPEEPQSQVLESDRDWIALESNRLPASANASLPNTTIRSHSVARILLDIVGLAKDYLVRQSHVAYYNNLVKFVVGCQGPVA